MKKIKKNGDPDHTAMSDATKILTQTVWLQSFGPNHHVHGLPNPTSHVSEIRQAKR